jgi:hypothetical protein
MTVVAFCEFVVAPADLTQLRRTTNCCCREAELVLGRCGARVERLLYDRVLAVYGPVCVDEAVSSLLELRRAVAPSRIAAGVAEGASAEWGRAHVVARALANAARAGEVLVDARLRDRLGLACAPARAPGIAAYRLLSGS